MVRGIRSFTKLRVRAFLDGHVANAYFVFTDGQRMSEASQPDVKRRGGLGGELCMFKGLLDHVTMLHSLASLIVPLSTHE